MKFSVDSSALADAVSWAQKSIHLRPSQPIMTNVVITADNGQITLSGFNYESSSVCTLAAYVDAPGQCLVPASLFAGIVKSLPRGKPMTFEAGERATITSGTAKFSMQTVPAADYPTLPPMPPKVGTIAGDVFGKASAMVGYAASKDESIVQLTGVKMTAGERLSMVATDRYRMSFAHCDWTNEGGPEISALVPASIVDNVARLNAGEIEVFADDSRVGFRVGNRSTATTTIAGEYPNVLPLFPDSRPPNNATASVNELLQVLGRASGISEGIASPVKLTFSGSELTVESGMRDKAVGMETIAAMADTQGGEPIIVGFNVHYLIDALKSLTTDEVEFGFQINTGKPALIREPGAYDAQQLVMPVKLDSV